MNAEDQVILEPGGAGYPERLSTLARPPARLYAMGRLVDGPAVAIVGARAADRFGLRLARRIASDLATARVTVVSGGARGIDQAAHQGALDGGGPTVMVLGCGLDVDYPKGSWDLRRRVSEAGAVITELPPGTPPRPSQFPRRNRIVAALVEAVLVVQAGERSGALVTAKLASELGRTVLSVPGMAGAPLTRGTHGLLRKGAMLAESAADVLEAIGLDGTEVTEAARPKLTGLAAKVVRVLDAGPTSAEEVARAIKRPVGETLSLLVELELEGVVSCHAGCYERV